MKKIITTHYTIAVDRKRFGLSQGIRIVLLSDLHNQVYGRDNERLINMVTKVKPDLVIVAGDMVNSDVKSREEIALVCVQRLAHLFPVYYANGNHETLMKLDRERFGNRYPTYANALRLAGVHLLENEHTDINIKGLPLRIFGLELPWRYYRRMSRVTLSQEELKQCLGTVGDDRYNLLIAHNPTFFKTYAEWGADVTFSGHIHGGFVRLPLLGGVISPQLRIFPKYDKGLFTEKGRKMVLSAGIGTHSIFPRIGNPVEMVVVDIGGYSHGDSRQITSV